MKKAKFPLVIIFSFLLSACSSSFVYNNIYWLLYWYVGDYVDFSSDQKATLDERIAAWQNWHRSTELEKYQTQLKNLRAKLDSGPLNQEQWLNEYDEAQQHLYHFRTKIAPELADIAQQLSPEQIAGILSIWKEKRQERQVEFDKQTEEEQLSRREERLAESVEDNIGTPDQRQVNIVKKYALQFIPTLNEQTAYQTTLQVAVRDIFVNRNRPDFKQQLVALISNPDQYKTSQYQAASEHNTRLYAQMFAELNLTLTQKQKLKLDAKLEDWISLIDDLISG
ncbi:hypothetical protein SAMN02745753_00093 [Marinomonas polaris DSM 16579]|uniref:Lipoprotein n=1 Tax=Marinomonas polaris DSM 16579 TaxID=1122206 RepID=A0A1M4SQW2_9GAMM|nr:DUF6279 family lipoprotein [Marinomonas polaris]SHE34347.1 hypothetical protein SAMN02745753_00093 [Marinomonas polaris DSM 16579]